MITIASIFRNSAAYAERYIQQVKAFKLMVDQEVRVIGAEGESDDDTRHILEASGLFDQLLITHSGQPMEGGTDAAWKRKRWLRLADAWNAALWWALEGTQWDDTIVLLESEIIWKPLYLLVLLDGLKRFGDELKHRAAIVPMVMAAHVSEDTSNNTPYPVFYDTHGFARGDTHFQNDPPFWPKAIGLHEEDQWLEVTTGGAMIVMRANSVRSYQSSGLGLNDMKRDWDTGHFDPRDCVYKPPHDVRMFMSKTVKVWHPPVRWRPEAGPLKEVLE